VGISNEFLTTWNICGIVKVLKCKFTKMLPSVKITPDVIPLILTIIFLFIFDLSISPNLMILICACVSNNKVFSSKLLSDFSLIYPENDGFITKIVLSNNSGYAPPTELVGGQQSFPDALYKF
jgi:hypothetical protein